MKRMSVTMNLPYYICHFEGSYSEIDRPTGLQYMLLTMIDSDFAKYMTWGKVIMQFGIPADIFERIMIPIMNEMEDMLTIDGVITTDSMVSNVKLTEAGKETLGKGVIAEKVETFKGYVVYIPAFSDSRRFSCGDEQLNKLTTVQLEGESKLTFDGIDTQSAEFDIEVENIVRRNKDKYEIDKESEIISVDVTERGDVLFFEQKIYLNYDEIFGSFSIDATGVDESFIKSNYDAEYILGRIDGQMFNLAVQSIVPDQWREDIPDAESYSFLLPSQLNIPKEGLMVNERLDNPKGLPVFKGEYDAVSIDVEKGSYGYYFVERGASINGIDGSYPGRYVMRIPLDKDECVSIVKESFDISSIPDDKRFLQAVRLVRAVCDDTFAASFVEKYLIESKSLPESIKALRQYEREGWFIIAVESAIAERSKTVEKLDRTLSTIDMRIDGSVIENRMCGFNGVDRVQLVDVLMSHSDTGRVPAYTVGMSDIYCDMILDGVPSNGPQNYKSRVMNSIVNASSNLSTLKEVMGIKSLSDYTFDLTELMNSNVKVGSYISTFMREVDRIQVYIRNGARYSEIKKYNSFFQEIRGIFEKEGKGDQQNARLFGINNGILLESILKKITEGGELVDMIEYAHENKIITDSDFETLNEFRLFRNSCAHHLTIDIPDKNKKKEWTDAIAHLKQMIPEEGNGK